MNRLRGTAILVTSATLQQPERVATLFLLAQSCAALEQETELYFTGPSVLLLDRANAGAAVGYGSAPHALGRYVAETAEAGVRLHWCPQALQALGIAAVAMDARCAGPGGLVQFAARCGEADWRTLVY